MRLTEIKMWADEVLSLLTDQDRASLKPFAKISEDGFLYFDYSQPGSDKHLHRNKNIKSRRTRRITGRGLMAEIFADEIVEVEL